MEWHDLLGAIGVGLILWAYAANQMGRMGPADTRYSAWNASGAALVLVSLVNDFNLSAALVESFWLGISLWGLFRRSGSSPGSNADGYESQRFVSEVILEAARQQEEGLDSQGLLTRREREILKLITEEKSNRQIAETLFISELTVETHRKNIFRKTGAASIVGLVNFAHANGLVEPT